MKEPRNIGRRGLLAGFAALPAAGAAPALASVDPDAGLLELGRCHAEAQRRFNVAAGLATKAEDEAWALRPTMPEVLRHRARDWHRPQYLGAAPAFYTAAQIQWWRDGLASRLDMGLSPDLAREYRARGRELVEAWDAHAQAVVAASEACGVRRLNAQADALGVVYYELERQIMETPATTPAGWRIKARIAAHVLRLEEDGTYETHVTHSLLRDLLASDGEPPLALRPRANG